MKFFDDFFLAIKDSWINDRTMFFISAAFGAVAAVFCFACLISLLSPCCIQQALP